MQVEISFVMDKDEDGVAGSVTIERSEVDSLNDLLHLYHDACLAAGYTYVESIGAHKEGGEYDWSAF
jgi:hypothetical protein